MKVFGLSESQIARRVKAVARAAGLPDWEFFSGHSGRVGMARRMAQNGARPPTRSNVRAAGDRAAGWLAASTPAASPPGQLYDICSHSANTDPYSWVPVPSYMSQRRKSPFRDVDLGDLCSPDNDFYFASGLLSVINDTVTMIQVATPKAIAVMSNKPWAVTLSL